MHQPVLAVPLELNERAECLRLSSAKITFRGGRSSSSSREKQSGAVGQQQQQQDGKVYATSNRNHHTAHVVDTVAAQKRLQHGRVCAEGRRGVACGMAMCRLCAVEPVTTCLSDMNRPTFVVAVITALVLHTFIPESGKSVVPFPDRTHTDRCIVETDT